MRKLALLTLLVGTAALFWLVWTTAFPPIQATVKANDNANNADSAREWEVSAQANEHLAALWEREGLTPADEADELTLLRRLSLALHGTIPSLEEIRRFESDGRDSRLDRWCVEMLEDSRFADYFSERIARTFVGTQQQPFLVFRRDRFKAWLSEQLKENRPYNEIVEAMIADQGLWTGTPSTNFITHSVVDEQVDEETLAGKTVRAVLGQRIDCAECHDHPFADWKQADFRGLAAFYGQVKLSPFGVEDDPKRGYSITENEESVEFEPRVPFGEAWRPNEGTSRKQLAGWCTHAENRRFARATVNRVWALMFGKAWSQGAPYYTAVDDLPDPEPRAAGDSPVTLLDLLADDFVEHGYDLRRLIRVIAASDAFRRSSRSSVEDDRELMRQVEHWAVFPLVRLRPEQVVGSILQASSIKTIDQNAALLTRVIRFVRENDFLREYGDLGDSELEERSGTIPQALLRMNGKLVQETTEPNPFTAPPRVTFAAADTETLIETSYLICLTRRPEPQEAEFFLSRWSDDDAPRPVARTQDLFWTLYNSPEFSWNH